MSSDSEGRSASEDDSLTGSRPDMAENSHNSIETASECSPTENRASDWNRSDGNI